MCKSTTVINNIITLIRSMNNWNDEVYFAPRNIKKGGKNYLCFYCEHL